MTCIENGVVLTVDTDVQSKPKIRVAAGAKMYKRDERPPSFGRPALTYLFRVRYFVLQVCFATFFFSEVEGSSLS